MSTTINVSASFAAYGVSLMGKRAKKLAKVLDKYPEADNAGDLRMELAIANAMLVEAEAKTLTVRSSGKVKTVKA